MKVFQFILKSKGKRKEIRVKENVRNLFTHHNNVAFSGVIRIITFSLKQRK